MVLSGCFERIGGVVEEVVERKIFVSPERVRGRVLKMELCAEGEGVEIWRGCLYVRE